ncbi:MAG TPA: aspartate--tRNA(Asn) ligase [Nitrososphaeraceae archaeon]|nr:aspartate--tRNA(Asn) ligase [Nitrososphaeraceae archaeon]
MSDLLQEEEIGQWRRTHYSFEVDASLNDSEVIIMGWVSNIRDHGDIQFIMIRDRYGDIQVIAKKDECTEQLFRQIHQVKEHSSLAIRGRVRSQEKAPNGAEIVPLELKAFSIAKKAVPFMVQSKTSVGIDTRLDLRAVDLRRNFLQSIFHIRHTTLNAIRTFLTKQGFIEINTPKMIATATEGGAALFPIFYYDREAFLAQSPQLYKEQLTMAFDNVFEIGPIFRAEPSRTNRHLSEAISIDIEKAFVDYTDIMILLEKMILYIVESIIEENKDDLRYLDLQLSDIRLPFPKYPYSDIINQLQKAGKQIKWGDDIPPQAIKSLQNDRMNGFYFITDWPTSTRPFYVKTKSIESERISESFDLMYGSLEISSGSTRINRKFELLERMKKQGLDVQAFDYHLRVFDYGVPPHAGFGVGLERLLMAITKVENIRDATLYPRDIDRLTP